MTTSIFERAFPASTPHTDALDQAVTAFDEQAGRTYESHQLIGQPEIVDSPTHTANGELLVRIHAEVGKRLPGEEILRRAEQAAR